MAPSSTPWTRLTDTAPWDYRTGHATVRLSDGNIILLGGMDYTAYRNDVWKSSDGITWECLTPSASWAPREGFSAVVLSDDSIVITGGSAGGYPAVYYNDVWKSYDGITWECLTPVADFTTRSRFGCVRNSTDDIFVFGGYTLSSGFAHDVWKSSDGIAWECLTPSAGWSTRYGFGSAILSDDTIVLLGGYGNAAPCHDVWKSYDGITWSLVTSDAPFLTPYTARLFFPAIVLPDDTIVVLGGYTPSGIICADVWTSIDTATWVQATPSAEFGGRYHEPAVSLYDGTVMIFGGSSSGGLKRDVWFAKFSLQPSPIKVIQSWKYRYGPL